MEATASTRDFLKESFVVEPAVRNLGQCIGVCIVLVDPQTLDFRFEKLISSFQFLESRFQIRLMIRTQQRHCVLQGR